MRAALLAIACLGVCGCQGAGKYWADRGRDAGDILDFKGGWALGVGAKAELTTYFGVGAGAGLQFDHYEKFGSEIVNNSGMFLHFAAAGLDGFSGHGHLDEVHLLGVSISQLRRPATFDLARVGAEVLLPGVNAGLYLNLGQLTDFLAGFLGFDPAGDDSKASGQDAPKPASRAGHEASAPLRTAWEQLPTGHAAAADLTPATPLA